MVKPEIDHQTEAIGLVLWGIKRCIRRKLNHKVLSDLNKCMHLLPYNASSGGGRAADEMNGWSSTSRTPLLAASLDGGRLLSAALSRCHFASYFSANMLLITMGGKSCTVGSNCAPSCPVPTPSVMMGGSRFTLLAFAW